MDQGSHTSGAPAPPAAPSGHHPCSSPTLRFFPSFTRRTTQPALVQELPVRRSLLHIHLCTPTMRPFSSQPTGSCRSSELYWSTAELSAAPCDHPQTPTMTVCPASSTQYGAHPTRITAIAVTHVGWAAALARDHPPADGPATVPASHHTPLETSPW
ncbi:hypothetical protein SCP_0902740 [Sparassis crispa]|uniref:Uncharacterized protein n=1 Tax=Sparassis crispa TaxID=139825 RepID=A0A401GW06_9APHY|nr:hypothetical protein SCP_0902740 [Sparassis crispa]GBE86395.1 hypothetical protein SCP_0902740 [Sparassis crispa]